MTDNDRTGVAMYQKWMPIESAPTEGVDGILGLCEGVVSVYKWRGEWYGKRTRPYWARDYHPVRLDRSQQPTHWMPLPKGDV